MKLSNNLNKPIMLNYKETKPYFLLCMISLGIFIISCTGMLDAYSLAIAHYLYIKLGYTFTWIHSYGPQWFFFTNWNISALASKEVFIVTASFFVIYSYLILGKAKAKYFFSMITTGVIVIQGIKIFLSDHTDVLRKAFLTQSLFNFPSGHAFISVILYLSIAKVLYSDNYSKKVKYFLNGYAVFVVILVGLSRIAGGGHTFTEVIAGWSLGLFWFSFLHILLKRLLSPTSENQYN